MRIPQIQTQKNTQPTPFPDTNQPKELQIKVEPQISKTRNHKKKRRKIMIPNPN